MSWWPFSSNKVPEESNPYTSLAPPAFSPLVPPPEPPKGYKPDRVSPAVVGYKPTPKSEDAYEREVAGSVSPAPDVSGLRDSFDRVLSEDWVTNPRARQCINNIQLGMKMGGLVGGIFGALAGSVYAVRERRFLVLPATMVVSAASFGFFLGCGMIIRCDPK